MATPDLCRVERCTEFESDLEHELGLHLAHGPETVHRMAAHEAVELFQLLVGEAEIAKLSLGLEGGALGNEEYDAGRGRRPRQPP